VVVVGNLVAGGLGCGSNGVQMDMGKFFVVVYTGFKPWYNDDINDTDDEDEDDEEEKCPLGPLMLGETCTLSHNGYRQ
jgi:hypothetical protein